MNLFYLVKSIFEKLIKFLKNEYNLVCFRRINSTSKIYHDVKLYKTVFEGFNVVFEGATLVECFFGKHTYVQKKTTIINAEIGKFCSIASNVSIGPGIHKLNGISTHPAFYLKNTPLVKTFSKNNLFYSSEKTVIGNDVWIGEGVIILDGISIGTGAVIAAGAVVTQNVNPYAIVGGIPAKVIRYRFSNEIINHLIDSQWWNYSEDWFYKNVDLMDSPIDFMKSHNYGK